MTPQQLETEFNFSGGTIIDYSANSEGKITFRAELIAANQPAPNVRRKDGDLIHVSVEIHASRIRNKSNFIGFAHGQDGEVSHFGIKRIDDDLEPIKVLNQALCELSFFVHDYNNSAADMDFVVISFETNSIEVELESD